MKAFENAIPMTLEEFAMRFAPASRANEAPNDAQTKPNTPHPSAASDAAALGTAAPADDYFVVNLETRKLELYFAKSTYDALDDAAKSKIKSGFLWSKRSACWVSRCKEPNLYRAKQTALDLGLADAGKTGERLSFAEEQERKAARAEARAERYEDYASNAAARGEALQKPIADMHGDTAFFTQPNINTSAGRAFTRKREKMFAALEKGFEEYNKSEYYKRRAAVSQRTADRKELQDKGFITRRIRECESELRGLRRSIDVCDAEKLPQAQAGKLLNWKGEKVSAADIMRQIEELEDRMERELDKLGYYQDALDALGGCEFSRENIKPGYVVRLNDGSLVTVQSTGPKNIKALYSTGFLLTRSYAEIAKVIRRGNVSGQ